MSDSSDSKSDTTGVSPLSDEAREALEWLKSNPDESGSIRSISGDTDLSRYEADKAMDELLEGHFIERRGPKHQPVYNVTQAGRAALSDTGGVSAKSSDTSGFSPVSDVAPNVHDLGWKIPLSEDSFILEENRETVLRALPDAVEFEESSREYVVEYERFHLRISGRGVIVYDKGLERGAPVSVLKNRASTLLEDVREYVRDELGLQLADKSLVTARLKSQDVAIEEHPLVQLVEASDSLRVEDRYTGEYGGETWLTIDASHGAVGELESTMRGPDSLSKPEQEDAINSLLNLYAELAADRSKIRAWRGWLRALSEKDSPEEFSRRIVEEVEDAGESEDVESKGRSVSLRDGKLLIDNSESGMVPVCEESEMRESESVENSDVGAREIDVDVGDVLENPDNRHQYAVRSVDDGFYTLENGSEDYVVHVEGLKRLVEAEELVVLEVGAS